MAQQTDSSYLINNSIDRNTVDLNRITQVRQRAPQFLSQLTEMAGAILAAHDRLKIVVVHGWNVNQSRCDFGIGAPLEKNTKPTAEMPLTISPEFFEDFLVTLMASGSEAHYSCGERFPARTRNNLLQLFRRDGTRANEIPEPLSQAVTDGRCDAVQIELGIPLRWPGPQRTAFVAEIAEAMSKSLKKNRKNEGRPARTNHQAASLQLYDERAGITLLASIDSFASASFARLAVIFCDGRVALYTGEAKSLRKLGRDGPVFTQEGLDLILSFRGTVLISPSGDDYVDLECALARSSLRNAAVDLRLRSGSNDSGSVLGAIDIGGERFEVDCTGFATPRQWGGWRRASRTRWVAHAAFADGSARTLRNKPADRSTARVSLDRDGYTPHELVIVEDGDRIVVTPLGRMSIARPVGPGRRARVTFGPARIHNENSGAIGTGIYEYARLIDR